MNNIIVAIFKTPADAGAAMRDIQTVAATRKSGMTDACGVFRDHTGAIKLNQMFDRPDRFFIAGLVVGGLVGFMAGLTMFGIFTAPLVGLAGAIFGLAFSTLFAFMKDFGINNDFLEKVGSELQINQAAIVIMHTPGSDAVLIDSLNSSRATIMQTSSRKRDQQAVQGAMSDMLHA